jgi:hypothetical protein
LSVNHTIADEEWAIEEFAQVELRDARLNRRCQELAVTLGQQPNAPLNQACEGWSDTKAAYRFFDNAKVTSTGILVPHHQCTVKRMTKHPLVLAVQDSTFFNYTHHPHTTGLGEIGTKAQRQRGFGMHSTLAVTPAGVPLGLPIEEKESYRWLQAFEQTLALVPSDVHVVTVCDREADIYEMFVLAQEKVADLLVRAANDRRLAEPEVDKLWSKVEQHPLLVGTFCQRQSFYDPADKRGPYSCRYTFLMLIRNDTCIVPDVR